MEYETGSPQLAGEENEAAKGEPNDFESEFQFVFAIFW